MASAAAAVATPAVGVASLPEKEEFPEVHFCGLDSYIKSVVFGGLDGIVTTFAIIASVVGADYPLQVVIVTGFAKLLGDGLSMGLGDAISESAEQSMIRGERQREAWEYKNFPEGEVNEMVDIYVSKGFTRAEAQRAMAIMTQEKHTDVFLDHMMQQELEQQVPGEDESPLKDGTITFVSFMIFGSIPLWAYVIFYGANYHSKGGAFGICVAITVLCMFALGVLQAIILKQPWLKQGAAMTLVGSLAAAMSYLVGWGLQSTVQSTC